MNSSKSNLNNKSFIDESVFESPFINKKSVSNSPYDEPYKQNIQSRLPTLPGTSIFSLKNLALFLLFVFILAFLGINIFSYLSEGTDYLTKILAPFGINIAGKSGDVAKTTTDTALTGTKKLLDVGVDTTTNVLDTAKKGTDTSIGYIQDKLKKKNEKKSESEPEPVSTSSFKQGYCFIGQINDTRYCAKVSSKSQCMSGDIYPTEDLCVNPNLK